MLKSIGFSFSVISHAQTSLSGHQKTKHDTDFKKLGLYGNRVHMSPIVLFSKNRSTKAFYLSLAGHSPPTPLQLLSSGHGGRTGLTHRCHFLCLANLRFYGLLHWKMKQILSHLQFQIPLVPSNLGYLCSYKIPFLVLMNALQHSQASAVPSDATTPASRSL